MSNTQSPRLSVQWIVAAKAAHFPVSLNTLRPGILGLPLLLPLGIVILVMEFMHEEERELRKKNFQLHTLIWRPGTPNSVIKGLYRTKFLFISACHPACETCNGGFSKNCTSCFTGGRISKKGRCRSQCPKGKYFTIHGQCEGKATSTPIIVQASDRD